MTEERTFIGNLITTLKSFNFLHKDDTVSSWSSTVSNSKLPTEKLVKDSIDTKQSTLVSGSNIKTVNNTSLLGSGNIEISTNGGSYISDYYWDDTNKEIVLNYTADEPTSASIVTSWSSTLSDDKVGSEKLVKNSLDAKSDVGHTHNSNQITDLSIPSASNTTPSADTTTGSVGNGTTWARSNHTHPKSSIYAESTHTHTYSNISNVSIVEVVVTYTDNSTETIKLLKYTG